MTPTGNGPQAPQTPTPANAASAASTGTPGNGFGATNPGSAGMSSTGVGATGTGSSGLGGDPAGAGLAGGPPGPTPTGAPGIGATGNVKQHLGEAGDHFRQAARDTGHTLRGAATAAGDELRVGRDRVKADLADGTLAGMAASEHARDAAREQTEELMEKGRELIDSAALLIRERPLASFGAAFAAGWVIAKLARSSDK